MCVFFLMFSHTVGLLVHRVLVIIRGSAQSAGINMKMGLMSEFVEFLCNLYN